MNKMVIALFAGALVMGLNGTAQAQLEVGGDLLDNCARIDGLVKKGDHAEARSAARLCLDGLDQQLESEVGRHFKDQVAGWKRVSFEQNKAMGFTNTSARYEKADVSVDVSLTGGAGGASAFGALSGLAAMGMMQSGKQVRVANLPAVVSAEGSIMVTLENGSFLNFESSDFDSADAALKGMGDLVNAFPVANINKTLVEGSK